MGAADLLRGDPSGSRTRVVWVRPETHSFVGFINI